MSQTELTNGEAILGGTRTSWDDIMAHVRAGGKIRRGMTNEDLIKRENRDDKRAYATDQKNSVRRL